MIVNEPKVIWSLGHGAEPDFDQARKTIDLGADLGVDGIEIACGLERCVLYTEMPELLGSVDEEEVLERRRVTQQIAHYARERGMSVGVWLREVTGPSDLLDAIPDLRADDGFIDFEGDRLGELIEAKVDEFFANVAEVDEVVLTLAGGPTGVFERPFCELTPEQRAQLVITAVADALRHIERGLAVRVDCREVEDGEAILRAVERVHYAPLTVVAGAEFPDANPFSSKSPFMRRVGRADLRVEADASARYYGKTIMPACYPEFLKDRLRFAVDHGAMSFSLRADCDGLAAAGTLNEINLLGPTAWARNQDVDPDNLWRLWLEGRLGAAPEGLVEMLDQTFEALKNALFIGCRPTSQRGFPSLDEAREERVFQAFERGAGSPLLSDDGELISEGSGASHAEIIRDKEHGAAMAAALAEWFETMAAELAPVWRDGLRRGLARLGLVARARLGLTRMVAGRFEALWRTEERSVEDCEMEAQGLLALADEIEEAEGADFFGSMPGHIRDFVAGVDLEQETDVPLREILNAESGLADYVLCGYLSEGHGLRKRAGAGGSREVCGRRVRESGVEERAGFSYELQVPAEAGFRLDVVLVGSGRPARGVVRLGPNEFDFCCDAAEGELQVESLPVLPGSVDSSARVEIWSSDVEPCRVAEIRVYSAEDEGES